MSEPSAPNAATRYREVYNRIRGSIADGALRPGDRLPSARALAAELKVARGTVETAYALLVGEGFLLSRRRSGTQVSPVLPETSVLQARGSPPMSAEPEPDDFTGLFAAPLPLLPGMPSFDLFPRTAWSQVVGRHARRSQVAELTYPDPLGLPALRNALVAHLGVARGIRCSAEQVVITGGYISALSLICRAVLPRGGVAWVENPLYNFTARAILEAGGILAPLDVDAEGLDVELGRQIAPDAALCVTAPSCQFPLGVSMSLRRRIALLDWAEQVGAWIVEDDYVGEFRYEGPPLPALKSLDHHDRVFYVGTFSKTLFPGLRLGYVVVPRSQLPTLKRIVRRLDGGRPALEQLAVADFLESGQFVRHVKRMRTAYKSRKAALAAAFTAAFGDRFPLAPMGGGLHLLARAEEDDLDLEQRGLNAGLRPISLSNMDVARPRRRGLLLGFTNVPEAQSEEIVARLAAGLATRSSAPDRPKRPSR
jgi:GntR family transcriptional regulator/MocR family aminotransferase